MGKKANNKKKSSDAKNKDAETKEKGEYPFPLFPALPFLVLGGAERGHATTLRAHPVLGMVQYSQRTLNHIYNVKLVSVTQGECLPWTARAGPL